ncbi:MAG: hypothetical protein AB1Z98_02440 [Nannocystaceae bacterium]
MSLPTGGSLVSPIVAPDIPIDAKGSSSTEAVQLMHAPSANAGPSRSMLHLLRSFNVLWADVVLPNEPP